MTIYRTLPNAQQLKRLGVSSTGQLTIDGIAQAGGGSSAPAQRLAGKTWMAYGDSITLWATTANMGFPNAYVSKVSADQGLTPTINGVLGRTLFGTGGTVDALLQTNPVNYDLITVTGGSITPTVGTITDFTLDSLYGCLNMAADWYVRNAPTKKFVFMTCVQCGSPYDRTTTKWQGFAATRQAMLDVGVRYSIPVVDWFGQSGITVENGTLYLQDGIHPNDAGYKLMSEMLDDFLFKWPTEV